MKNVMNIYLVERTDLTDWDEYTSHVCYAKTEAEARSIVPSIIPNGINGNRRWWVTEKAQDTLRVSLVGKAPECSIMEASIIMSHCNRG